MEIDHKNILLTGASSGIGRELLLQLTAFPGVRIVAIARHIEPIPVQEGIIFPFSADLSTEEGVDRAFAYAQQVYGETDILIANAGFAYLEAIREPDWKHIGQIFSLNVFSPVYAFEKLLAESGRPKTFVPVISGVALVSLPGYSLYCATKAALHRFAETVRYEQRKNVQLTAVYPVATRTAFFDKASRSEQTPLPFPQQGIAKVAETIIRGILRNKKRVYPSRLFAFAYPFMRAFPFLGKIYALREKKKVRKWLKSSE